MTQVVIRKGTYRNQDVSGLKFKLVRDFVTDAKGGNVVVANGGHFPGYADNIRVRVDSLHDIEFVNGESVSSDNTVAFKSVAVAETPETDEAVMTRIRERFDILTEMTKVLPIWPGVPE